MRVKKSYVFAVDFEQEEDGRWSVDIPAVPVCAAWGFTRKEALENLAGFDARLLRNACRVRRSVAGSIDSCEVTLGNEVALGLEAVTVSI